MTDDQMRDFWQSQPVPSRTQESLGRIIVDKNASTRRQLIASFSIAVLALGFGLFNFWGQYFQNENPLLVSLLRALPVLMATVIHVVVSRRLAEEQRERVQLAESHGAWLTRWVDGLETEVHGKGIWKLAAFLVFLVAITSITKWLDYRSGEDSLAECISIVVAIVSVVVIVLLSFWHYQTQFLVPELQRCKKMLEEVEDVM